MPRTSEWIVVGSALLVAVASCVLLLDSWWGWSAGPWADCPNYAFGKSWYPEPPLIATLFPVAASVATSAMFIVLLLRFVGDRRRPATLIASAGLAVAVVPVVATIALPMISNALGMTTAGC